MSDGNALADEMRQPPASSRSTPPALDRDTADRLLAGRLDPGDAPAGYAAVARLLAAATAPPSVDELAGEQAAVAEFAATARSHPPTPTPRRAVMPRKRFGVKAAVVAVAAVLTIGGVAAAATGVLPGSAQRTTDRAPASSRGRSAADTHQGTATGRDASGPASSATTRDRGAATGPDASGPAKDGLCRAWLAGNGAQRGKKEDSTAFQALARAAGGADRIAAYCQAGGAGGSAGHGRQDPPPTSNPAADPAPGNGHGQGKGRPPTTG
jgi:hypothetical protein